MLTASSIWDRGPIVALNNYVKVRIRKARHALHQLDTIWKSRIAGGLKTGIFRATVEIVLLYASTAWTPTQSVDEKFEGACGKMLRVVKDVTSQKHLTKEVLSAGLPRISTRIRERSLRFGGHCWRSKNEDVSDLVLWGPKHG